MAKRAKSTVTKQSDAKGAKSKLTKRQRGLPGVQNKLPAKRKDAADGGELGGAENTGVRVNEEFAKLREKLPAFALYKTIGFEGSEVFVGCVELMAETVDGVSPRDPLELMLVQQLAWCHQRVGRLSMKASTQSNPEGLRIINELVDRAMNSYRRGMLALREYRAPHRGVSIGQLNQAEQQNIMLAEKPKSTAENATNEQGT